MKSIIVLILSLFVFSGQSVMAQAGTTQTGTLGGEQAATQSDKIKWEATVIDMGDIPYNVPAKAIFEFTNISEEPVIILTVRSSCGCTVPDYSKEPILPNENTTVTAIYNARGLGVFQKSITVVTNDNVSHKLTIKGKVVQEQ